MPISYVLNRFPPPIIQHAVYLCRRSTLSYRDTEDLLAKCGFDISCETIRFFLRASCGTGPRLTGRWRMNEMVVIIGGKGFWLWRAVDHEGEVLDLLV